MWIASHRGLKSRARYLGIAVERNGARGFAVFTGRCLLHPEAKLLVEAMHVRIRHLPQQVVQLRSHAVVVVADLGAEIAQIDQKAERIAVALGSSVIFGLLT